MPISDRPFFPVRGDYAGRPAVALIRAIVPSIIETYCAVHLMLPEPPNSPPTFVECVQRIPAPEMWLELRFGGVITSGRNPEGYPSSVANFTIFQDQGYSHVVIWVEWRTSKLLNFCVFRVRIFQGWKVGVGAFGKCEPNHPLRMRVPLTALPERAGSGPHR